MQALGVVGLGEHRHVLGQFPAGELCFEGGGDQSGQGGSGRAPAVVGLAARPHPLPTGPMFSVASTTTRTAVTLRNLNGSPDAAG